MKNKEYLKVGFHPYDLDELRRISRERGMSVSRLVREMVLHVKSFYVEGEDK